MASGLPLRAVGDQVRVTIHLTPRARAERIDGIRASADGSPTLCVSVTAPPTENQANDALLRLLAREWKLPRRDLTLVAGHKSRDKVVGVAAELTAVAVCLQRSLAGSRESR